VTLLPFALGLAAISAVMAARQFRRRGDGMPPSVWAAHRSPPPDREPPPPEDGGLASDRVADAFGRLSRPRRILTITVATPAVLASLVVPRTIVPAVALCGMAALILLGWPVIKSTPSALRVEGDELLVKPWFGPERPIPIDSITEIRCPPGDGVFVVHDRRLLACPRRIAGLEALVIELRRRNPAITYDGPWPPRVRAPRG
jgi:hypothetical protein